MDMGRTARALMVVTMLTLLVTGCTENGPDYFVTFEEPGLAPMVEQGSTKEGTTTTIEFELDQTNMTKVEFELAWSDDSGDGCTDLFEMTVISASPSADYLPHQTEQGRGSIEITAVVNDLPKNKESDDREGLQDYLDRMASSKGVGLWKVSITCVNAQPDCPEPKAADDGNSWVLTVNVLYHKGSIRQYE